MITKRSKVGLKRRYNVFYNENISLHLLTGKHAACTYHQKKTVQGNCLNSGLPLQKPTTPLLSQCSECGSALPQLAERSQQQQQCQHLEAEGPEATEAEEAQVPYVQHQGILQEEAESHHAGAAGRRRQRILLFDPSKQSKVISCLVLVCQSV